MNYREYAENCIRKAYAESKKNGPFGLIVCFVVLALLGVNVWSLIFRHQGLVVFGLGYELGTFLNVVVFLGMIAVFFYGLFDYLAALRDPDGSRAVEAYMRRANAIGDADRLFRELGDTDPMPVKTTQNIRVTDHCLASADPGDRDGNYLYGMDELKSAKFIASKATKDRPASGSLHLVFRADGKKKKVVISSNSLTAVSVVRDAVMARRPDFPQT